MSPEKWERLKDLFEGALDLQTASERARFIDLHCDDAELRRELESLLAEHDRIGQFIEGPAPGLAAAAERAYAASMEGRQIGPYRLTRKLGEGGMGSVYLAVRADEQFQKQVAVKLLRPGAVSTDVVRRFLAERQILANLEHPFIARLLDGGATRDGEPYLVMEYVNGVPIDRFCSERGLSINERLSLFGRVCSAVEYAHRNLIVHRDLKPANILVEDDGSPKLLDFGIAKLLRPEVLVLETSGTTRTGFRLMTPEYASPEQIRGEPITTVSDVYSLGILLYELLTGQKPYCFTSRLIQEVARVICEEDPAPPSTAAKAGAARSPDSTAAKSTPPTDRNLSRRMAGDLDAIVLMALRKEPERRYQSVAELRNDLERRQRGLPVMARKDSLRYRGAKFLKRNRLPVAAAALVIAAGAVALWQANLARHHAMVASRERALMERVKDSVALRKVWSGDDVDAFGSVSPDGHYLSFTDWNTGDLAVRDLHSGATRRLTHEGARDRQALNSVFAPDSRQIAYTWLNGGSDEVRIINVDGSGERLVFRASGTGVFVISDWWGSHLLGSLALDASSQLALLSTDGRLRTLEAPQRADTGRSRFSPDGKLVLHNHLQPPPDASTDVFVYSLESGADTAAVVHPADDYAIGWLPGPLILFASDRTGAFGLWATRLAAADAVQIQPTVGRIEPMGQTRSGSLYLAIDTGMTDVYVADLDAAGTVSAAPRSLVHRFVGHNRFPVWSPDGRNLLYETQYAFVETALVIRAEGEQERQLHPALQSFRRPLWRRDKIAVAGTDGKRPGIYEIDPATGKASLILGGEALSRFAPTWSRDGNTIFSRFADLKRGIFRMQLATGKPEVLWTPPPGTLPIPSNPALSPDETKIAFPVRGISKDQSSLLVLASRGGAARTVFTATDSEFLGAGVAWLPDSRTILFSRGFESRSELWAVGTDGHGARKVLAIPVTGLKHLSVSANGRRIAFQAGERKPVVLAIDNLSRPIAHSP